MSRLKTLILILGYSATIIGIPAWFLLPTRGFVLYVGGAILFGAYFVWLDRNGDKARARELLGHMDTNMLDYLEEQTKKSRTGSSFDYANGKFRFMTVAQIDPPFDSIRECLFNAMGNRKGGEIKPLFQEPGRSAPPPPPLKRRRRLRHEEPEEWKNEHRHPVVNETPPWDKAERVKLGLEEPDGAKTGSFPPEEEKKE